MPLITLASTSSGRKKLLEDAGLDFLTLAPGVDEEALVEKERPAGVCEMTLLLARAKAIAGAKSANTRLVLGCDSALEFEGQNLGKPLTKDLATKRWQEMRGKSGYLHSGPSPDRQRERGDEIGLLQDPGLLRRSQRRRNRSVCRKR